MRHPFAFLCAMSVLPAWARGAYDAAVSGQTSRVCAHADHEGGVDDMGLLSVRISKSHKSTPAPANDPGPASLTSESGAPGYYFKDMCAGTGAPTTLCQTKDPEGEVDKLMADMTIPAGINKTELKAQWVRALKGEIPLVPEASLQATQPPSVGLAPCLQASIGFDAYLVAIPLELLVGMVGPKIARNMMENLDPDAVGDITEEAAEVLKTANALNKAKVIWESFKKFWNLTGPSALVKAFEDELGLVDGLIAVGTFGAQIAVMAATDGTGLYAEIAVYAVKLMTVAGFANAVYHCCDACGDSVPWNSVRAETGACR